MDINAYAQELSSQKGQATEPWATALNIIKADAGRARISIEKLDTIIELCKTPQDLETAFNTILNLHRDDRNMKDGWSYFRGKITELEFSLSAWCRAIETLDAYLEKNALTASAYDSLEYIACITESPEIKNGTAPLATAVNHYLEEYGLDAATPKN